MTFTEIKAEIEKIPNVYSDSIKLRLIPPQNRLAGKYSKIQASLEFRFEDKIFNLITDRHYEPNCLIAEIKDIIESPYPYINYLKVMEKR